VDKPLKSVTHGQCNARPTVTFPVAEHHRPLTGTKLYCLVTEAHGCWQLAQSCCLMVHRPGVDCRTRDLSQYCGIFYTNSFYIPQSRFYD